jgi:uncharacterized protein (DUF2252 family)
VLPGAEAGGFLDAAWPRGFNRIGRGMDEHAHCSMARSDQEGQELMPTAISSESLDSETSNDVGATADRRARAPRADLIPAKHAELGKAARRAVPRSAHGSWSPPPGRDPIGVLQAQDATRVQELVPIRWGRMLVSPFTFYRGAAALMAADLASTPDSGLRVQLCGDAHISNFGVFAAPDRSLVFDLNDFDETLPGPWEWDVKRMAASIEIAGRDRGEKRAVRQAIVRGAVSRYRDAMREFAGRTNLEVWYARLDIANLAGEAERRLARRDREEFAAARRKAQAKSSLRALTKLTEVADGKLRFRSVPPLLVPLGELLREGDIAPEVEQHVLGVVRGYKGLTRDRRHLFEGYRVVDMARKVVGVGSVGTRAWAILLLGRDTSDPLVLQAKEAQASVLEPFAGASRFRQHGERVVEGQRLMQAASDIFLGWHRVTAPDGVARDFYVRQLWDGKGSSELDAISTERFAGYAEVCGWTLARAHARSGDRIAIASYLGAGAVFDSAMVEFSEQYADQTERDFALLQGAVTDGRIAAQAGV